MYIYSTMKSKKALVCNKKKLNKNQLKKRLKFYHTFYNIKNKQLIIPYLSDEAINLLCEAVYNTLNTDLGLKGKQKSHLVKQLKACGSSLQSLCKKTKCIDKRKKYLTQKGGFLGALLAAVIPTLASLIGSLTKKK